MARFFKKSLTSGPILAVVMISLTAIITHGLIIPRLGYYHDDWYMLWSGASRGVDSLVGLFSMDRPFIGVIYRLFYRLFRESIPDWHLAALFLRIMGGLAFYWIINLVWPGLKRLSILAGMLFVVFPGFLAEPNAATKINHLLGYGAALFSIALTLQAARSRRQGLKWLCTGLSMLLMALYLWIYEYMIGLEVMRLALLFWIEWQGQRGKGWAAARRVLLAYLPYLLVAGAFLFWRVFIFESTRSATDLKGLVTNYQTGLVSMVLRLVFQTVNDFFSAAVFAWFIQPYQLAARASYGEISIALLVTTLVVAAAVSFIRATHGSGGTLPEGDDPEKAVSPYVLIAVGALITLAAVFPVVLSNRHIDLMDSYKAYALHPSAGAIFIVLGLVIMLKPRFRDTLLVALLALVVFTQSLNNQDWANYWEAQRNFWWQLTWRAPDIRDDTLVMAYLPDPYTFQQDYEIWGPVNLIYRPGPQHFPPIQSEVLNRDTLTNVVAGSITDPHDRDIFMPRNFNNLLLMSQPTADSCVHVIDGTMPAYSASERPIIELAGAYSHIQRIIPSGAAPIPPQTIFGSEPEHGWCYYYQQAELARQTGDWQRISDLYHSAAAVGLHPGDASEYFVFIEGMANLGRTDEAKAITAEALKDNDALKYTLCQSVTHAPDYPSSFGYRRDQIQALVCN